MFQSLFSWMTLIGSLRTNNCERPVYVSILVFLDDAHRPDHGSPGTDDSWRFQSLFSWMTLIGAGFSAQKKAPEKFQSLFSWMTLIGVATCRGMYTDGWSFNPCFLG